MYWVCGAFLASGLCNWMVVPFTRKGVNLGVGGDYEFRFGHVEFDVPISHPGSVVR